MPAATRKKPAPDLSPAGDNVESGDVYTAKRQADDIVAAKLEAIKRARAGITAAEADLEKCRSAIARAKEVDAKAAATNLDRGAAPVAPWHTRDAVSAVERAEVALEIADAAHRRLKAELAVLEDDAATALNEILVAIKWRTRDDLLQYMEELRTASRRAAVLIRVLSELVADDERLAPRFHDTMRGFRASAARDVPFADVRAEVAHLLCGASMDDHEAALEASKLLKAALIAMRTDPQTALPKV